MTKVQENSTRVYLREKQSGGLFLSQLTMTWQSSHSHLHKYTLQKHSWRAANNTILDTFLSLGQKAATSRGQVSMLTKIQPTGLMCVLQVITTKTVVLLSEGKKQRAKVCAWRRSSLFLFGGTHTDASSIHPQGKPPGLRVKGHAGARRWRQEGMDDSYHSGEMLFIQLLLHLKKQTVFLIWSLWADSTSIVSVHV